MSFPIILPEAQNPFKGISRLLELGEQVELLHSLILVKL